MVTIFHFSWNPILPSPASCQVPASKAAVWVLSGAIVSMLITNDFVSHVAFGFVFHLCFRVSRCDKAVLQAVKGHQSLIAF
jgi:hypothetical protein